MSHNDITTTNSRIRHITPPKEELQSLPSAFYNCDICGLRVKTQSNLRAHFIKTHGLVNDAKDVAFLLRKKTDIYDVFHCPAPACKYTKSSGVGFSKFWHLKQHYQLVHMKKTFQCTTCGQRFSTPSAQAYHAKSCGTHFECPVCGRKYKAKKFLNQHARRSGHDVRTRVSSLRTIPVTKQQSAINLPIGSTTTAPEGVQREAQTSTRLAILPLLILPLGVGADQASVSAATASAASLVSGVIAQLRSDLTVLPPVVSNSSPTATVGCPGSVMQINSLSYSPETRRPPTFSLPNSTDGRASGCNGGGGPTFLPLVDVGTATLRLSHAHTQTEVNVPPHCPVSASNSAVTEQQTDFAVFYNSQMTRDSYTATSPPDCRLAPAMSVGNSPPPPTFMPDMSHSSTYMSPGHSIELQYPEMNSNGTMTTYHSQQPPQPQEQHHAFQQTTAIPTTTVSSGTGGPLYISSGTSENGCYNAFAASGSNTSPYSSEWRSLRRPDDQSANSVAVETTFDLANFDASNSGNCYWPPAESFAHMQTQTVCDAEDLEQWLTNVQTQTSTTATSTQQQQQQQQSSWTSLFASDGNQLNYIRFANFVAISEIRIVPFGSVVDSNLSDEAVIGTTNPALFNIKFYCYNDNLASTLFQIAEYDYNESNGICCVPLTQPVTTNILLLRGDYSTITVAVFGMPCLLPPQQSGIAMPNFSVPPPPLVSSSPAYPVLSVLGSVGTIQTPSTQLTQVQSSQNWPTHTSALPTLDKSHVLDSTNKLTESDSLPVPEEDLTKTSNEAPPASEDNGDQEKNCDVPLSTDELLFDSEETASNLVVKAQILDPADPLLKPSYWRFNPLALADLPDESLPAVNRQRLPSPNFTLFEVHKWLLSIDRSGIEEEGGGEGTGLTDSSLLTPPPPDASVSRRDADRLIKTCNTFGIGVDKMEAEWLNSVEELVHILPSGLAFLSLYKPEAYESLTLPLKPYSTNFTLILLASLASNCLIVWVHAGLQLDSALRQPDSVDILRHLRVGVELVGVLLSTTCETLATRLLQSTPSSSTFGFQAQHVLMDLLESPLVSTPLRLHVVGALERSLGVGVVGFNAFVGQEREGIENGVRDAGLGERMPTPYERISVPVALACNRVLAQVRFYDTILQFDDFMKRLKKSTTEAASLQEEVEKECALQMYLATVSRAITDPEAVLSSLPKDAPKLKSLKSLTDLSLVLYKLLDSTHFLDHLIWLLNQTPCRTAGSTAIADAARRTLAALLSTPAGLLFLASAPASAGQILRAHLRQQRRKWRRLGFEMAVKLEALGCIDTLIAITRRKGETGCQRYMTEVARSESANSGTNALYTALFSLARLFLTPDFAPWAAEVVAAEAGDFFVPCLILLEAAATATCAPGEASAVAGESEQGKPETEPKPKSSQQQNQDQVQHGQTCEALLSRLGFSSKHIETDSLLSIITVGLLRHASNVRYLERFAPRLLRIVQSTAWEERLSSLSLSELFSHQRTFYEAGAPWLFWLREASSPTLITSPTELFAWYADQLGPLVEMCQDSLTIPPPALLLLLRLLRLSLTDNGGRGGDIELNVIELYARDGLATLSTLIDCTADHLLLQQPNARGYVRGSAETMIADMMAEGVEILTHLVIALVDAVGEDFRDRTPVKAVCRAYAAAAVVHYHLSEKIRRNVLRCISAYSLASQDMDTTEGTEKDLWSSVCREILSFTISSPSFFLPGLQLLLDMLPLPLPVETLKGLSSSERQTVTAARDWWCHRLTRDLAVEVCGLVEVLSASPPDGALHRRLTVFVDRITALGSFTLPQMLAASATDTLLEVYQAAGAEISGGNGSGDDVQHHEATDSMTMTASVVGNSCAVDFNPPLAIKTLTSGSKLVLGAQQSPTLPDSPVSTSQPSLPSSSVAVVNEEIVAFGNVADASEILHALSLLHFVLHHPVCKQSFLDLIRKDSSSTSPSRPSRSHRLLLVFSSILEGVYPPESRYHLEAQGKVIECINCLLDTNIGLKAISDPSDPLFDIANHLPPAEWLSNLVACLLTHLHPSGRASTPSAAKVLCILHRLALHDFGFVVIQRHLCQKQHERVLANLLQGLIDRFSTECRATLGAFLLLISALLADPIFAEEAVLAAGAVADSTPTTGLAERQLRLSTLWLRQLLGWGGSRSENLVKEMTSKLDTAMSVATDADSSNFRPLRDGMKSLLHLLGGPEDISTNIAANLDTVQPFSIPPLPIPLTLVELYNHHHNHFIDRRVEDLSHLLAARRSLYDALLPPFLSIITDFPRRHLHTINLLDYASHVCPGVDLRAEVAAMGSIRRRRRDVEETEAMIHHKRRRKGQASDIIQTGRSAKKYVAPMRGRGFTIRQSTQSSSGGGSGGGSGNIGGGVSSATGGSSLLGVGVATGGGVGGRTDVFRSRPQNTSRPPSLHVDDFNKLEKDEGNACSGAVHELSYGRDSSVLRGVRDSAMFRGGRGGGVVGSQRVLSTLPFVGSTPGTCGILPSPVVPLQSWPTNQSLNHHLLTLTNPTVPSRSTGGNMPPPRID
ncbi:ATM interactor [Taenia crassiceps]|uniref:ATM interactor n=1 Tax=Taenia crassiceps TaxID=6207 RepID=A0ABR4QFV6_9CEST